MYLMYFLLGFGAAWITWSILSSPHQQVSVLPKGYGTAVPLSRKLTSSQHTLSPPPSSKEPHTISFRQNLQEMEDGSGPVTPQRRKISYHAWPITNFYILPAKAECFSVVDIELYLYSPTHRLAESVCFHLSSPRLLWVTVYIVSVSGWFKRTHRTFNCPATALWYSWFAVGLLKTVKRTKWHCSLT